MFPTCPSYHDLASPRVSEKRRVSACLYSSTALTCGAADGSASYVEDFRCNVRVLVHITTPVLELDVLVPWERPTFKKFSPFLDPDDPLWGISNYQYSSVLNV
jgi:hypothetical protein